MYWQRHRCALAERFSRGAAQRILQALCERRLALTRCRLDIRLVETADVRTTTGLTGEHKAFEGEPVPERAQRAGEHHTDLIER